MGINAFGSGSTGLKINDRGIIAGLMMPYVKKYINPNSMNQAASKCYKENVATFSNFLTSVFFDVNCDEDVTENYFLFEILVFLTIRKS